MSTRPSFRRVPLLNVHVDDLSMDDLLGIRDGVILTLHADMLVKLQHDREFHSLMPMFDVVTCDSQVLYFLMKVIRRPVQARVSGSDYFPALCHRYKDDPSVTIFLCGAEPGVADEAATRINRRTGRDIVVGTASPPFGMQVGSPDYEALLAQINASGATVLVVGFGAPKQEKFIAQIRDRLPGVRLYLPLGGTIDYEAGAVKRPPGWVTNIGMEWAWRVVREPRRRWRRYLVDDPKALLYVVKDGIGRYRDPFAESAGTGA